MPVKNTKLAKWGNSKTIRIPASVVKKLNLKVGQNLNLKVQGQSIIVTPAKKHPKNIHELFDGWKDDGVRDHELDWGDAQGSELPW